MPGNQDYFFLKEIKKEFDETIQPLLSESAIDSNSEVKVEEIKIKTKKIFFSHLEEADMLRIKKVHEELSVGLGTRVGIAGNSPIPDGGFIWETYSKQLAFYRAATSSENYDI